MRKLSYRLIVTAALIGLLVPSSRADIWSDAVNVITDPLKLDASTENIIHAVERMDLMLKDLQKSLDASGAAIDKNIRDYIQNVDTLMFRTFDRFDLSVAEAADEIGELEEKILDDASEFLLCSTTTTLDQMQVALSKALNSVGDANPRFVVFGWELGSVEITPQDIVSPIDSYDRLKLAAEKRLSDLVADSEAKHVEFVYGEMQRVAHLTKCHYPRPNQLADRLERDIYEYRRLHQPWAGLVR